MLSIRELLNCQSATLAPGLFDRCALQQAWVELLSPVPFKPNKTHATTASITAFIDKHPKEEMRDGFRYSTPLARIFFNSSANGGR